MQHQGIIDQMTLEEKIALQWKGLLAYQRYVKVWSAIDYDV